MHRRGKYAKLIVDGTKDRYDAVSPVMVFLGRTWSLGLDVAPPLPQCDQTEHQLSGDGRARARSFYEVEEAGKRDPPDGR